jgi:hypothetical protein
MAEFGASAKSMAKHLPKATKVKNKHPADRQITAEQLLRESKEIQLEDENFKAPKTIINDPEELAEYRLKKRKEFEDMARRVGRFNLTIWVKVRMHAWGAAHGAGQRTVVCAALGQRMGRWCAWGRPSMRSSI